MRRARDRKGALPSLAVLFCFTTGIVCLHQNRFCVWPIIVSLLLRSLFFSLYLSLAFARSLHVTTWIHCTNIPVNSYNFLFTASFLALSSELSFWCICHSFVCIGRKFNSNEPKMNNIVPGTLTLKWSFWLKNSNRPRHSCCVCSTPYHAGNSKPLFVFQFTIWNNSAISSLRFEKKNTQTFWETCN